MSKIIEKGTAIQEDLVEKYSSLLPDELIEIWKEYGLCDLLDGYLRVINPEEYQDLLNSTYFFGEKSIPIFCTAFGDIITFEDGTYIGIVKYKNGNFHVMSKSFKRFWRNLEDETFQEEFFDLPQFMEAVQHLGRVKSDECYGYVPLLGLGGTESVSNLKIVDTKVHIEIISSMVGNIGM